MYLRVLTLATFVLAFAAVAQAQATRTWVSGVGDDVNPCSRTAPCKTYAGAISKTATGGEISVLDPGGYGALTITKAITVDGGSGAGWGSTLFASTNGFTINITTNLASDKVILRNLSLNGGVLSSLGVDGIRFLDGAQLTVENVDIFNFSGDGIEVFQSQACNLFLKNVRITHGGVGIKTASSLGTVNGTFEDVEIDRMTSHGFQAISNTAITARDMVVARSADVGNGIQAEGATVNLVVENSTFHGNNIGVNSVSATVRITNVGMFFNNTNLSANVLTCGGNRSAGNSTTNTPAPGGCVAS